MTRTDVLYLEDFPEEIIKAAKASKEGKEPLIEQSPLSLEEMEKIHIIKILEEVGYNKSRASEILGIDRATLYRKAQRYGISLDSKHQDK
jgi:transcriptional regulator of acetoin/glycerol metabolism